MKFFEVEFGYLVITSNVMELITKNVHRIYQRLSYSGL